MRYACPLFAIAFALGGAHTARAQSEPVANPPIEPTVSPAAAREPPLIATEPPPPLAAEPAAISAEPAVVVQPTPIVPEEPALAGVSTDRVTESAYPIFEPKARLMMGAELRKAHPIAGQNAQDNRQPFFLEQARLELDIEANAMLSGSFSAELDAKPVIRDAYVDVKLARKFQIRAGHFKRPMSRIELIGTGKLPFRDRGLFNRFILRHEQWGNRSLGVMLWGKFKAARFNWYAAVMNANDGVDVADLEQIRGADTLGRVEYEPTDWLSIGVNGGYKVTELYADGPNIDMFALGGDIRLRAQELRVVVESIAAQNPNPPVPPLAAGRTPFAAVVTGYATYDIALGRKIVMQPTLVGEWYDSDTEFSGDQTVRAVAGLNFLFFDQQLRLLPQVEIVRPVGGAGLRNQVELERYYLLLSAEL